MITLLHGAVHGAVLDLVGEHVEARVAPAVAAGGLLRARSCRGGESIQQTGARREAETPAPTPPIPAIQAIAAAARRGAGSAGRRAREQDETSSALKQQIDALRARRTASRRKLETTITQRGLVIRLLTDKRAVRLAAARRSSRGRDAAARPQVAHAASDVDRDHPIVVEGHTDDVPIASSRSSPPTGSCRPPARRAVVRFLIATTARSRTASRPRATPRSTRSPRTRPPPAARATAASRSSCSRDPQTAVPGRHGWWPAKSDIAREAPMKSKLKFIIPRRC